MNDETVTYTCPNCGWFNTYTRAEIERRRGGIIFREGYEEYSLPCKNPMRPPCPARYIVAVPKQRGQP